MANYSISSHFGTFPLKVVLFSKRTAVRTFIKPQMKSVLGSSTGFHDLWQRFSTGWPTISHDPNLYLSTLLIKSVSWLTYWRHISEFLGSGTRHSRIEFWSSEWDLIKYIFSVSICAKETQALSQRGKTDNEGRKILLLLSLY